MLNTYTIKQKIAVGDHSKVKLVEDPQGKFFTAKILNYDSDCTKELVTELQSNEVKILQSLASTRSVQLFTSVLDGKLIKKSGNPKPCVFLLTHYCELGSFSNLIKLSSNEHIARHFFVKSVNALESIHSQGVKHLNLRIENFLIDLQMNVRICGFSKATSQEENKVLFPNMYSAPEVLGFKAYEGKKVDVFALGVVVFIMVCGVPPFHRASVADCHFKLLQGNSEAFWSSFCGVSEEFKELIKGMLCENPAERYDLERAKQARWAKAEVLQEEVENMHTKLLNLN